MLAHDGHRCFALREKWTSKRAKKSRKISNWLVANCQKYCQCNYSIDFLPIATFFQVGGFFFDGSMYVKTCSDILEIQINFHNYWVCGPCGPWKPKHQVFSEHVKNVPKMVIRVMNEGLKKKKNVGYTTLYIFFKLWCKFFHLVVQYWTFLLAAVVHNKDAYIPLHVVALLECRKDFSDKCKIP